MQIAELTYIYEMMIYRMSVIVCMNTVTRFCSALLDQGKMNKRFGYSSRPLTPLYGPGSIVGIVTGYRLDGPGNESRWGRDFPHRPGAHQASCTMGTGSFPGVKSGRGVTLTPHPLLVQWS